MLASVGTGAGVKVELKGGKTPTVGDRMGKRTPKQEKVGQNKSRFCKSRPGLLINKTSTIQKTKYTSK